MDNKEEMQEELSTIENQIDNIVDEMIEKYGKFLTLADAMSNDRQKISLVSNYNSLMKRKEYLVNHLSGYNF
ncbi:MAG: hypothetical protein LKJ88_06585 [Bacilli bacterium]|jgi:hypothetical protein|nr:hypothetical protein [Bacilli bacterium]